MLRGDSDALSRRLFVASIVALGFAYGVGADHYDLFPVPQTKQAIGAMKQLLEQSGAQLPWWYHETDQTEAVRVPNAAAVIPGLRLISGLGPDQRTQVKVIDVNGRVLHEWRPDWFTIWPDPTYLPENVVPKTQAPFAHGMAIASNGDLIFNFEWLSMVRVDACGRVVWKLPYRTHHSIHLDEQGNIWAPRMITRQQKRDVLPNYEVPFDDYSVLEVSPDGRILRDIPVADLLVDNGLAGLLYLSSTLNRDTRVSGDTLHLNDVDTFPSAMATGVFAPGDVMISLRNVNTILVFDPDSRKIKFHSTGAVIRQHDPDFADGNTITVFDNNLSLLDDEHWPLVRPHGNKSRIVEISALTHQSRVLFSGSAEQPFFTDIMGQHQRLPNGNMLLTESVFGRVVEVDPHGQIVWEYYNLQGNGLVGIVGFAMVLPPSFDEAFFAKAVSACTAPSRHD